ncbi:TPA: deaminase, partial [Legionella pneumophila]
MENKTRNPFELVIALVGGVGTDFQMVFHELQSSFKLAGCNVEKVKITEYLKREKKTDFLSDLDEKIHKMNGARENGNKGIAAFFSMMFIFNKRIKIVGNKALCPTVYIIDSLKSPYECDVLRNVYGRNFILLSIYDTKDSRKSNLLSLQLNSLTSCENLTAPERKHIDEIMDTDENEGKSHGRDTKGTYHKAHYFINMVSLKDEVRRLVNLLFNEPFATPTRDETGMLYAYFSSLRSSDPSRQVGAVIMDNDGNILSSGCNEVPKFGGGLHWHDTHPDLREYKTIDENRIPLGEQIKINRIEEEKINILEDSLEFIRAVHAEEAAICDAARRGVSTQDAILYCTTFPCHLCIKHIIAAGIKEVVYIEPYIKSMAKELFNGLIKDKATSDDSRIVKLRPFTGVSPKRYRYVFAKSKQDRKDKICKSRIINWCLQNSSPVYLSHSTPISYFWTEFYIFEKFKNSLERYFNI